MMYFGTKCVVFCGYISVKAPKPTFAKGDKEGSFLDLSSQFLL
jgi:hypothetical protein